MSAHRLPFDLHIAPKDLPDPGNAGSIVVDRDPCVVNLVSAGTETRTLARPTRSGIRLLLYVRTYVASGITVTVTGNYDTNSDSTILFTAANQWAYFVSFYDGTNYKWMLVSHYALGNMDLTAAGNLAGLVASVTELNRNNKASTREILAGATITLSQALHDGVTVAMPAVCAVTLPASTGSGSRFKLYQKVAATAVTITATAADMYGVAWFLSDNAAAVLAYEAAGSTIITMAGSVNGGRKGAIVEIEDVATNLLLVRVMSAATGTEASPFS